MGWRGIRREGRAIRPVRRWVFAEFRDGLEIPHLVGTCSADGGHGTELDARRCYQKWRLGRGKLIQVSRHDTAAVRRVPVFGCEFGGCGVETNGYISEFGYLLASLCNTHLSRGCVAAFLGEVAPDYVYEDWG